MKQNSFYSKIIFAFFVTFFAIDLSIAETFQVAYLGDAESTAIARSSVIGTAEQTLDVATYSMDDDASTRYFLLSLIDASARGIKVRLLVDHYGRGIATEYLNFIAVHGIEVRLFNSQFLKNPVNYALTRTHAKLLVSGNGRAIVGGRNFGDKYTVSSEEEYLDADVLVESSNFADEVRRYFDHLWTRSSNLSLKPIASKKIQDEFQSSKSELTDSPQAEKIQFHSVSVGDIEFINDLDPQSSHLVRLENEIQLSKHTIVLTTPHPVLPRRIFSALESAVKRKVNVIIVTNSYATNVSNLAQSGYEVMTKSKVLNAGMRLWETSESSLHAKISIFDKSKVYVGSFNWDNKSAQNFEGGVLTRSPDLDRKSVV